MAPATALTSSSAATNIEEQSTNATLGLEGSPVAQTSTDDRDRSLAIALGSSLGAVILLLLCLGIWGFSRWWRQRAQKQAVQALPCSEVLDETMPRVSTERLMRESNESSGFDRRWSLIGARKARSSVHVAPPEPPPRSKARPSLSGPLTTHGGLWDASMAPERGPSLPLIRRPTQPRCALSAENNMEPRADRWDTDSGQESKRIQIEQRGTEVSKSTHFADLEHSQFQRPDSFPTQPRRSRARSISIGEPGRIHYPSKEELSQFKFGIVLPTNSTDSAAKLLPEPEMGVSFSGNFVDFLEIHGRMPQV